MNILRILLIVALAGCASFGRNGNTALDDATWRLIELDGAAAVATTDSVRMPWLQFDESEMRASGNGGCNRMSGPYTRSGSTLSFGPLVSTRMACAEEALNRQEAAFGAALMTVDRFEISDDVLTLSAGSTPRVRLRRTTPAD